MKRSYGVFNTNLVNKSKMICPAGELMRAEEENFLQRKAQGIKVGMPSNISHDMHRPCGWTQPIGLSIDGKMVKVLGAINFPENEIEIEAFNIDLERHWKAFHKEGLDEFGKDLQLRLNLVDTSGVSFLNLEAYSVKKENIAAKLYPEFFLKSVGYVDKDGLVDYSYLLEHTIEVQPGVFHDKGKNLILFAHRFYRRRLSHRNKLNDNFLTTFKNYATKEQVIARIRLDPDLVGHPSSVHNIIELEYWHGPHFSDDITEIPAGVTEHKADESVRFYEGIDKTQFWWKEIAVRSSDHVESKFRVFEAEELIELESIGVSNDYFGCRYAHAEFSVDSDSITHFDGAIRGYPAESYFNRIDLLIDKAGKNSEYSKLFRFDGTLSIDKWKRLMSDFYKGNKLIPEYLGILDDVDQKLSEVEEIDEDGEKDCELIVLVAIGDFPQISEPIKVYQEYALEYNNDVLPYVEIGSGSVANYLSSKADLDEIATVDMCDEALNLSRICFGVVNTTVFDEVTSNIARSLIEDSDKYDIRYASIPLTWKIDSFYVTLTIAGQVNKVSTVLETLSSVIDVLSRPSSWIESLASRVQEISSEESIIFWQGIERGVMTFPRQGELNIKIKVPDSISTFNYLE